MTSVYDALRRKAAEQHGGELPEPAAPAPVGASTETGFGLESEVESSGLQPELPSAPHASASSTIHAVRVPSPVPPPTPEINPDTLRPVTAVQVSAEVRKAPTRTRFERIEMPYRGKTILDQEIST